MKWNISLCEKYQNCRLTVNVFDATRHFPPEITNGLKEWISDLQRHYRKLKWCRVSHCRHCSSITLPFFLSPDKNLHKYHIFENIIKVDRKYRHSTAIIFIIKALWCNFSITTFEVIALYLLMYICIEIYIRSYIELNINDIFHIKAYQWWMYRKNQCLNISRC